MEQRQPHGKESLWARHLSTVFLAALLSPLDQTLSMAQRRNGRGRRSQASGLTNELFHGAPGAQEAGVFISPAGSPYSFPSSYPGSRLPTHPFTDTEMGPRRLGDPQAGTQHSACARSHTPPARTHSPSPVAASAVLCGHPVNTWSAGGRPPCRYTCPHCPGQSCTPASSPRGWWATPGGGQVGKGVGREQENEGESEGGWRLGARG